MKDSIDRESLTLLKNVIRVLKQNHGLSLKEMVTIYNSVGKKEPAIPVSIFSTKLSPSESLCRYLKDNQKKSFHEISLLIQRDERSIWTSYNRASKKSSDPLPIVSDYVVPVSIFKDRTLSILEALIAYLVDEMELRSSEISRLINRNPSLVHTVLKRARKKIPQDRQDQEIESNIS